MIGEQATAAVGEGNREEINSAVAAVTTIIGHMHLAHVDQLALTWRGRTSIRS
jgi:hypothetical protein